MTHNFLFVYLKYTICNYTFDYSFVYFIVCLFPQSPASLRTKAVLFTTKYILKGFPGGSTVKNPLANARAVSLIPVSRSSLGERNILQKPTPIFLLENSMYRGAWQATFCGFAKEWVITQRLNNNICILHSKFCPSQTFQNQDIVNIFI